MRDAIARVVAVAEQQALGTLAELGDTPVHFPRSTLPSGEWETVPPGDWTSGFWPGVLWQLHALTGKQAWADAAQRWQAPLANRQQEWAAQHDFGERTCTSIVHMHCS